MSELDPQADQPQQNEAVTPERAASVQLRAGGAEGDSSLMDPANQSLADALRITFRGLQLVMILLGAAFVVSGFTTVELAERGVSVFLGKPRATELESGLHVTAPYPFGELIKVPTGNVQIDFAASFWPNFLADNKNDETPGRDRELVPGEDGSLITADLNIAHAQWQLTYRRDRVGDYIGRLLDGEEQRIIEAAFERAVVRAVAETTIDELLKPEAASGALAERVQRETQALLDRIAGYDDEGQPQGIGISIESVLLRRKSPPGRLIEQFAAVTSARTDAQRARTDAEAARAEILNGVAGLAASDLLGAINRYEAAIETEDRTAATTILAEIDGIFDGESSQGTLVSGDVAGVLATAEADRAAIVSTARGDLAIFLAKQASFEANPSVMVARDWAESYSIFLAKPFVQAMRLPTGVSPYVVINEDPDIIKEMDEKIKEAEAVAAFEERDRARRLDRFRTERGIIRDEE